MKEVFYKLFGLEPISAEDRETFALLPVVVVFSLLCFGAAVLLG